MFPISYRDPEVMLPGPGVKADQPPLFRWIQAYTANWEKRIRPHLRMSNGSCKVHETYVKSEGRRNLDRAVGTR